MHRKRDRPKRQYLVLNDDEWFDELIRSANLPYGEFWPVLPQHLTIANLLPANVDAPDWGTHNEQSIWRILDSNCDRCSFPTECAEFEQFLDEHFPREEFAEFRHAVDNPNLMGAPKQGVIISPASKLDNYRFIMETRRYWRAAARIDALIAEREREKRKRRPPLLRICVWCQALFIAWRNNTKTCQEKCGAAVRQARKRAKAKEYELKRELNISKKNDEQRKPKGASR
jgi:hypothetical protein